MPIIYRCDECPSEEEAKATMNHRWLVEFYFGGNIVLCPKCVERRQLLKLENGIKIAESLKQLLKKA